MTNNLVQGSKEESSAQKAGYLPEEEGKEENSIHPSEVSTKGNFWDRAGVKTIAVGGIVFLLAVGFAALLTSFTTAISTKEPSNKTAIQTKIKEEEDIGKLKTTIALGTQKAELEKLNSSVEKDKLASTPAPAPTPTTSVLSTSTPKPTTITSAPRVVSTSAPPATADPKPIPSPILSIPSTIPTNQKRLKKQTAPLPKDLKTVSGATKANRDKVVSVEATSPTSISDETVLQGKQLAQKSGDQVGGKQTDTTLQPTTGSDPNTAWQQAAGVGMYIDKSETGKVDSAIEMPLSVTTGSTLPVETTGKSKLIVGTHATGRLQTPFFWTGNSTYQKSYVIKLTQPLKDSTGVVVIPQTALLVARVQSVEGNGWLDMSVVSIVIQGSQGNIEKPIPDGAVLIQGENGFALKAEYKRLSSSKKNTGIPTTQEEIQDSGEITSETKRKALVVALKGQSQKLDKKPDQTREQDSVFVLTLDKDALVQVYINRSFSL